MKQKMFASVLTYSLQKCLENLFAGQKSDFCLIYSFDMKGMIVCTLLKLKT